MSKEPKELKRVDASRRPPALSTESEENHLISLAVRLAEKQLVEGTASAQVITHFLKLGTVKAQIELEKMRSEVSLAKAKADAIKADEERGDAYREAIEAMKLYSGHGDDNEEDIF